VTALPRVVGGAAIALGAVICVTAHAVQRTRNQDGLLARWTLDSVRLEPGTSAATERTSRLREALRDAVKSWSEGCLELSVEVAESRPHRGAQTDGVNAVVVLDDVWCRAGRRSEGCYDARWLAKTTVGLRRGALPLGGVAIEEADIEINGVTFDWFGDRPELARPPVTLTALLAHELGHVLGLDDVPSLDVYHTGIMTSAAHEGRLVRKPSADEQLEVCKLWKSREPSPPRPSPVSAWFVAAVVVAVLVLGVAVQRLARRH
jgi:hypothetical protein